MEWLNHNVFKLERAPRRGKRSLVLVALVIVLCVACDQAVKAVAKQNLASSEPISLLGDLVRFEYAENTGALLSLGAELPRLLRAVLSIVFTGAVVLTAFGLAALSPDLSQLHIFGLALVAGGGVGNLIDRLSHDGAVVDFVSMGFGLVRTGIFNVADVAIMGGVGLLLFLGFRDRHNDDEEVQ